MPAGHAKPAACWETNEGTVACMPVWCLAVADRMEIHAGKRTSIFIASLCFALLAHGHRRRMHDNSVVRFCV